MQKINKSSQELDIPAGNISSSIPKRVRSWRERKRGRPPKKESMMVVEIEANKLVSDNDECPHCNGIGKLNVPGVPDCPHCRGTGVMELFLTGYPKNEATISGKSQNLLYFK